MDRLTDNLFEEKIENFEIQELVCTTIKVVVNRRGGGDDEGLDERLRSRIIDCCWRRVERLRGGEQRIFSGGSKSRRLEIRPTNLATYVKSGSKRY